MASCSARTGASSPRGCRNFPDPEEVFAAYGADAMRWYLLSSPVLRGLDVVIEEKGLAEPLRLVCNPIWNSWYFLSLYANADGLTGRVRTDQTKACSTATSSPRRGALSKTSPPPWTATTSPPPAPTSQAFLDALTNWYVRRSRDRFWRPVDANTVRPGEDGSGEELAPDDKQDAYDTLHTVLEVLTGWRRPSCPS